MKVQRDSRYESGFVRTADHDAPAPEELARRQVRKKRLVMVAIATSTLVAIGAAGAVAYQIRRDTPARQVQRGIAFSKTSSHVAAIIEYKRSLQEQPDQPDVRILLGNELSLLGDSKGAEIEYQKATDARYQLDRTTPLLVGSLLHQGKFDRVIEVVNGTPIDSPEGNADLLATRGSAYFALGREAEAQTSWAAAKEFVPGHPATLLAEARARASKADYDGAGRVLDGISADAPQTDLLTLRGDMARATGKPLDAVKDYEAALKIEPSNLFVRTNLAQTLVELSRFDEASVQIRKVLGPMPNNANAHFISALIAIGQKDFQKASEAATKAVQLTPSDGRYQLLAGTLAYQLEQPANAEQYLGAAVTLMPQNVDARRLLALIYVARHEPQKADQLFAPVFAAFRGNQDIAGIAARIALQQGDSRKAARAFDEVDPADPKNIDATLLAASLKLTAGDRVGGFARLRTAALASPDNADVDAALVMAHLTFNENADALAAWNGLARKEPATARTYNLLAAIDLARGDKPGARRSMQQAAAADPRYLAPVSGLAMLDLGDRRVDDAKQRLRQFIATNPDNADARLLLVDVEKNAGPDAGHDAAARAGGDPILGLLRDAQKANPTSPKIVMALARYAAEHGDSAQALAVANQGLTFAPHDAALLLFVGDQSLAAGDTASAVAAFTRLTDENGAAADYPMRLGLAQIQAGKFEEALTAFRRALSRQPNDPDRQYAMVGSLLSAGRLDEASRALFEIGHLSPKSPVIPELDADVRFAAKQFPEAIVGYQRVLTQRPSSRVAMKTYNALVAARRRGEADTVIADWLRAHPGDEQVRLFDADIAMRAGEFARASKDLRVVSAAHPNDALLLNNLAWNLAQLGDPQAVAVAEKANAFAPDNAAIGDTLGWMLVEKGDARRGLALIEKASLAAPTELVIRLHLAKAQLKQGQTAAARTTLQRLVAAAPDSEQGKASRTLLATL